MSAVLHRRARVQLSSPCPILASFDPSLQVESVEMMSAGVQPARRETLSFLPTHSESYSSVLDAQHGEPHDLSTGNTMHDNTHNPSRHLAFLSPRAQQLRF